MAQEKNITCSSKSLALVDNSRQATGTPSRFHRDKMPSRCPEWGEYKGGDVSGAELAPRAERSRTCNGSEQLIFLSLGVMGLGEPTPSSAICAQTHLCWDKSAYPSAALLWLLQLTYDRVPFLQKGCQYHHPFLTWCWHSTILHSLFHLISIKSLEDRRNHY